MALTVALAYLIAINLITYLAFRADKRRAEVEARRVPETRLLLLALCGGWFGAKLAQRTFQHKTRKQPFRSALNMVPLIWIGLAYLPSLPLASRLTEVSGLPEVSMDWSLISPGQQDARDTPKFFESARN